MSVSDLKLVELAHLEHLDELQELVELEIRFKLDDMDQWSGEHKLERAFIHHAGSVSLD